MNKKLLELRSKMKRRKPTFARKDSNKKKRIEDDVWRRPRGCDNKQRLKKKGHKKNPGSGYKSPVAVRGLDKSGLVPVIVSNASQIALLTKTQGAIIASSVGSKNRMLMIQEAQKKGVTLIGVDAKKAIEKIKSALEERKKAKQAREKETKIEPEKKPEAKEPEKDTVEESEEEKKKAEKAEKDKILTKKQ